MTGIKTKIHSAASSVTSGTKFHRNPSTTFVN